MPHLIKRTLNLEAYDGKLHDETEITLYGLVHDFSQLEGAHEQEDHEQWQLLLDTKKPVKTRLRLVNKRLWTMTAKKHTRGQIGAKEVDQIISEDMFNILRIAAVNGYPKRRYNFLIPGTDRKWEVDVFMDQSGNPHPWVKIDYEFEDIRAPIPDLPIDLTDVIVDGGAKQTLTQKRFVRELWEHEWLRLDELPEYSRSDEE